ncbi:helix-turn-helix domain-containing protein [Amycolatopsis sp. CA-128772]|uniref:helix-turn-helix domain-containing protein n=1 Tax=Amycolatopsis sp. CA-128772 TaxID=2073159 RepID=UPI000CD0B6C6|nr:helix-turn-helix domain-containing protein [Amycolatopsis sp. CA-128772]
MTDDKPPTDEAELAQWCKRKYEKDGLSIRGVADAIGRSYAEANRLLKKAGTKMRPPGTRPIKPDPALSKAYNRGGSIAAAAAKFGLKPDAARRRLQADPNVTIRRHGPAFKPPADESAPPTSKRSRPTE